MNLPYYDPLAHLRPALAAARDAGIRIELIGRGGPFATAGCADRFVVILCDDTGRSAGPQAFDRASLEQLFNRVETAIVHAWALEPLIYMAAVVEATFLQHCVVIVETRLPHESEWVAAIKACGNTRIVVTSPAGARA